jgi:hypothetical protein
VVFYVRFLMIRGKDVEVSVARAPGGYLASLRILAGGGTRAVERTFQAHAASADEADRRAQAAAREYLEEGGGAGNGI